MFSKSLVPLDGSDRAATILNYLRYLVTPSSTSLVFLRAVSPQTTFTSTATYVATLYQHSAVSTPLPDVWADPVGEAVEIAHAYLEQMARPWRQQGISVETRVQTGMGGDVICEVAAACGADVIALTIHGSSGETARMAGTVVDHVVRHSHMPIIALRDPHPLRTVRLLRRILVPLDGSSDSETALALADSIAWGHDATLVLSRAVPPVTDIDEPDLYQWYDKIVREDLVSEAEAYLNTLKTTLDMNEVSCDTQVVIADTADAVLAAIKDNRADLVVLGAAAPRGFGHGMFGWTVDHVLRHATRPVLVMREGRNVAREM